jgi:hypothetical protein
MNLIPAWVWVAIAVGSLCMVPEARQAVGRIFVEAPKSSAPDQPDYIEKKHGEWAYFSIEAKAKKLCASNIFTLTGNPYYGFACEWKK